MCESCGCIPCDACGAPVQNGICAGCGEMTDNCTCELPEEEFAYDDEDFEDDDEDFDDEDEDEDEEEEEEEYEDDDEDDEDEDEDW